MKITNLVLVIPCKIVVLGHTVIERGRELAAFINGGWNTKVKHTYEQNKMRRVFSQKRLSNAFYSKTLMDFEEAVVCPAYNHATSEDYHNENSPLDRLCFIQVPTLVVASDDDPITGNPEGERGGGVGGGGGGWGRAASEASQGQPTKANTSNIKH